jgi:WD40 repeat protein
VGDSPKVYLHRITGSRCTTFTPITTLTLPPPTFSPLNYSSSSPAASFSTAFSADGSKFAIASQEGSVIVWDVRSSKPLKIFHTDKTRTSFSKDGITNMNGNATGWLSDDPWDWSRGTSKAPGWGVRSVKFGGGGDCGHPGREVMTFTEVRYSYPSVNKH